MSYRSAGLALLATLTLVAASLAVAAQPGPGGSGTQGRPDDEDDADEHRSADNSGPTRCNTPDSAPCPAPGQQPGQPSRPAGLVTYVADADGLGLRDYTVDGHLLLASLRWSAAERPSIETHGAVTSWRIDDERLRIHDSPGGLLAFNGRGSTLALEFPAGAAIEKREENARVRLADGAVALLRFDDAEWTGERSVVLEGFVGLHLPPADEHARRGPDDERYERAIQERRLGAQVAIGRPDARSGVEVLSYDDVQVNVSTPEGQATPEDPLTIRVEAALEEGRTVALDIERDMLPARSADQVVLRYFDVNADGTQTEVVLQRADDITDILDPTNDAGQPEFWVVFDADGAHVLVSVPHWSVHVFTVAAVPLPSIVVGLAAGGALAVLAAVAMFGRRKQ